jgi:hypothetical protein
MDEEWKETEERRKLEKGRERKASRPGRQVFEIRIKNERQDERATRKRKRAGKQAHERVKYLSEKTGKEKKRTWIVLDFEGCANDVRGIGIHAEDEGGSVPFGPVVIVCSQHLYHLRWKSQRITIHRLGYRFSIDF